MINLQSYSKLTPKGKIMISIEDEIINNLNKKTEVVEIIRAIKALPKPKKDILFKLFDRNETSRFRARVSVAIWEIKFHGYI